MMSRSSLAERGNAKGVVMKKILWGVILMILGIIVGVVILGPFTTNLPLVVFGVLVALAGLVLLMWGIYQWQRKK